MTTRADVKYTEYCDFLLCISASSECELTTNDGRNPVFAHSAVIAFGIELNTNIKLNQETGLIAAS